MAIFEFDGCTSFGFRAYVEAEDEKQATKIMKTKMIEEIKSGKVQTYTGPAGAGMKQTIIHEYKDISGLVDDSNVIRED